MHFFTKWSIISPMKRFISEQLNAWKSAKDRKPLIIRGARQVGKTYSLKAFGSECFHRYHYVNFEEDGRPAKIFEKDLDPIRIIAELSFYLNRPIDTVNDLLVFDEIQACPKALTSLKYFCEKIPQLAVCSAGSLLGLSFGAESFPVGKVDFLNIYPMSFAEFLQGTGETQAFQIFMGCRLSGEIPEIVHDRLWELLKIYFVSGGLPEIINTYNLHQDNLFSALQAVREKQNNLVLAYEADIAKHSGKLNSMHIGRVWRHVPAQLALGQDGSAPKFKFKGIIPGVKGFQRLSGPIDWLQTAGLIIKCPIIERGSIPFTPYIKENFFKLYLFDVGILGAIAKIPPRTILDYDYGSYKGYFVENFVAQEFICSGQDQLFCWQEGRTAEVEFLREVDGRAIPIEVKSGGVTQSKSLDIFCRKYSPPFRVIISAGPLRQDPRYNVHHYPIYLAGRFPLPG